MLVICSRVSFSCAPSCPHKTPHAPLSTNCDGSIFDCNVKGSVCSMIKSLSNTCCCVKVEEYKATNTLSARPAIKLDDIGDVREYDDIDEIDNGN